jgi:hypothetical protein
MRASRRGGAGGGWWWLWRCSVERSRGVGGALHGGDSRGGDLRLRLKRIRRRRLGPDLGTAACAGGRAATTSHSKSLRRRCRVTRGSHSVLVLEFGLVEWPCDSWAGGLLPLGRRVGGPWAGPSSPLLPTGGVGAAGLDRIMVAVLRFISSQDKDLSDACFH